MVQAEDRAHRVGQKGTVLIRYLLAPGTCDVIMWALLVNKLKVVGQALDGATPSRSGSSESAHFGCFVSSAPTDVLFVTCLWTSLDIFGHSGR